MSKEAVAELSSGPMWDLDAEAIVLSAIFEKPDMFDLVQARVANDDFSCRPNWAIWAAFVGLRNAEKELTPAAVWAWLNDAGRVGDLELGEGRKAAFDYLCRIVADTPDYSVKLDPFVDRIIEKSRMRRAKWIAGQVHEGALTYSGDVQAFIDRAVEAFREVADRQEMLSMMHISDVLREKFTSWSLLASGRTAKGVSTGFSDLDQVLGGLKPETLNVLAARPGAGKSALALNIATAVASYGGGVAFFSLEMSRQELTDRQLAALSGVSLTTIGAGGASNAEEQGNIERASQHLSRHPMWIDDTGKLGLADIRAKAKRVDIAIRRAGGSGLALIVVDYIGLMQEPQGSRTREQAIAANSRGLKLLAKETKVPVLLLAQMNRDIEKRSGRPKLSDLRESGSLEADSDSVLFIHRDDAEGQKDGPTELVIAKNRGGPTGMIGLHYRGFITRFDPLAKDDPWWEERRSARKRTRPSERDDSDRRYP